MGAAVVAWTKWDGTGEPEGWIRHRPSHRRRIYIWCNGRVHRLGYLEYVHP